MLNVIRGGEGFYPRSAYCYFAKRKENIMTNREKSQLAQLAKDGKTFAEIRKLVTCHDATIKRYMKVFADVAR